MKIEDEIKSNFRNEYHKLRVNLLLTTTRLGEKFQLMLKEFDLSPAQFNTLCEQNCRQTAEEKINCTN